MQPARQLVGVARIIRIVEFAAGMQLGHDHLGRGNAFFLVDIHRNATAIVAHRNRAVSVDNHGHSGGVTGQSLVNAVVDNLVHHVVQTRPVVSVANIHAGALANSVQPLENLDRIGAVAFGLLGLFGHR